jgi:hypothetical protein
MEVFFSGGNNQKAAYWLTTVRAPDIDALRFPKILLNQVVGANHLRKLWFIIFILPLDATCFEYFAHFEISRGKRNRETRDSKRDALVQGMFE